MTVPSCGGERFDVGTHDAARAAPACGDEQAEAVPHCLQIAQHAVERRDLFPGQPLDVDARRSPGLAQADDLTDLGHAETEATGLGDECDDLHGLVPVHAISGRCATQRSQNPGGFIDAQRLAAHASPCDQSADRQSRHVHTVDQALGAGSSVFAFAQPHPPARVRPASARRKKLPSVTTRSPAFKPSITSAASPAVRPSFTGRSVNLPSSPSVGT